MKTRQQFYYPIDLHYSQTKNRMQLIPAQFYYPIDLHYSQTYWRLAKYYQAFYYPIDLHYSQTGARRDDLCIGFITL